MPQLALERNGNDALLRDYVHGHDLVSMTSGGADYYFHYDSLGSVMKVTNSSGAAQWTYSYEPFGALRSETKNNSKAPTNVMKFTGEYLDTTGLYHLRARQMDPTLGRFTATDPLTPSVFAPSISEYVYANDRPSVLIDPSGLIADYGASGPSCWPLPEHWNSLGIEGKICLPYAEPEIAVGVHLFDTLSSLPGKVARGACTGVGERFIESVSYAHTPNFGSFMKGTVTVLTGVGSKMTGGVFFSTLTKRLVFIGASASAADILCDVTGQSG